jgi:glyoxylase-like metal-dependent hydrolase (beta-lactamase superfamily II)
MKMYVLDLGDITSDISMSLHAEGIATKAKPQPTGGLCTSNMAAFVFEHPKMGLILYDTGVASNRGEVWPPGMEDEVYVSRYDRSNHLEQALSRIGIDPGDINAIIISHLHLDHAGGLETFRGYDVPIYVHEQELKNAFHAVATKEDFGPFLPHYLDPSFNWKSISMDTMELAKGLTLHRVQGHTEGLLMLEAQLPNAGSVLLTSDMFQLRQNYEEPRPLGHSNRDTAEWWRGYKMTANLAALHDSRLIFGHDPDVLAEWRKQEYHD